VSRTVTVKLEDEVLPRVSLAAHVIVFVPSGSVDPEGGTHVTGRALSTASLADGAVYVMTAPDALDASVVTFDGVAVIVGPVVS
jgi:hypothetical protein